MTNEQTINEVKQKIASVLGPLSDQSRANVLRLLNERLADDERKLADNKVKLAAIEELKDWMEAGPPLTLERNDCSRLHKLKDAMQHNRLIDGNAEDTSVQSDPKLLRLEQTFVVRHDWAGAFANADGIDDNFRLPYDLCSFEFRLAGRTIILAASDSDGTTAFTSFIECRDYWYSPPECDEFLAFLWSQIRAICIALDAEIATSTVTRAPLKLNEKRAKSGAVPLSDFHMVDLARRHRVANPAVGQNAGSKKRLHFRRGHWRHYEESKTWVRWCLVGSPDLGFISKQYSL